MFDLAEALSYIQATIDTHLDTDARFAVWPTNIFRGEWSASLYDVDAKDAHVAVENAPSMEAAIIRLACAIREESDIGG